MKKLFFFLLAGLSLMISCEPDDPDDSTDDPRDKIENTWRCDENSQVFSTTTYTVDIKKDATSEDKVLIYRFYNLGAQKFLKATLNGTSLTISNQIIDDNIISGSGLIMNNFKKIQWTYYVDDGSGVSIDTVSADYIPAY
ncbi:MAG: hypothetical protein ABIJ97_09210 [Bacteroidota bacterium]